MLEFQLLLAYRDISIGISVILHLEYHEPRPLRINHQILVEHQRGQPYTVAHFPKVLYGPLYDIIL